MLSLFFAQSFKSYGHFLDHVVEITLSLRHVEKRGFFRVKRIQQSARPRGGRHGYPAVMLVDQLIGTLRASRRDGLIEAF